MHRLPRVFYLDRASADLSEQIRAQFLHGKAFQHRRRRDPPRKARRLQFGEVLRVSMQRHVHAVEQVTACARVVSASSPQPAQTNTRNR